MVVYRSVYPFSVLSEIEAGKTVYVLDKKMGKKGLEWDCRECNQMKVSDLFDLIKVACEDTTHRFLFWKEVRE